MYRFDIYNADRERIGELHRDDSVQWLEHYQAYGEVKIVAQATPDNLTMLIDGNRIYNTDTETVARISHRDDDDMVNEKIITVYADITSELLTDRVVMATVNITDAEIGMLDIYAQNRRDMPMDVGEPKGYTEQANTEVTWGYVLDAVKKIAESSGLGFKVTFDPETGGETFEVYKGVDRSDENSDDYIGYFGTDVNSIENVSVTSGTTDYKNVAIVAGAGEGADRTVRIVSIGSPTGENRRELYVDARDLQREYQHAIDTGTVDSKGNPIYNYETRTYSEPEYLALLDKRGMEKLAEHAKTFSVTCDITQNNIAFGVDYGLGDRIPLRLPEKGIYATVRVASVNRIYEREGTKIVAILNEFELEVSQQ